MASFSPQTVIPDLLLHHRGSSSLSKREALKQVLQPSSLLASSAPSIRRSCNCRRGNFQCAAVTGGSKRDIEKLVARTKHRRPRHMKGVTPSTPELMEELEEEEAAEEEISKEVARILDEERTESLSDNPTDQPNKGSRGSDTQAKDRSSLPKKERQSSERSSISDVTKDAAEGAKGAVETTEDTATDVVDIAADTQKQMISDAAAAGESVLGSVTDVVDEQSSSSSSESEEETLDDIRDSTREIADITADTTSEVGDRIMETGEQVQEDVAEAASAVGEVVSSQTNAALDSASQQAGEAQDTAETVADVAMDTIADVNKTIGKTGEQLGQDFAEVASSSEQIARDSSEYMGAQAKDFASKAEKVLQKEGEVLEQGVSRLQMEANRSLGRVQDSVQKAARESARAARDIGREALGIGELLVDTAKEAIQETSGIVQNRESKVYSKEDVREGGTTTEELKTQTSDENYGSSFTGFKVLIAGASGQTGRLVVENLLGKGASVRALVRDVYRARSISQLKDTECIEADLYNYETVRKAIGECNVVICTIGARAFPFDPVSTYQVEYEGVLNLISAAKNQGKVKKFVLVSTIGVTYLQLVPLIFWKKQAELYLQRSGLDYTIVRPGGLKNTSGPEDVVMQGPDSQFFGSISRKKVAEVCLSAIVSSDASHKIVEVVSVPGTQRRSIVDLFKQV